MERATRDEAGVETSIAFEQKQEETGNIKPPIKKWIGAQSFIVANFREEKDFPIGKGHPTSRCCT